MSSFNLIVILGPTASGKTKLAVAVADALGAEIISADSRQVYRGMNIGTGKDLDEYVTAKGSIPYHLIDIREAGEEYNVFEFQKDFFRVYENMMERGKMPLLCGGTGLYIDAVLKGYIHTPVPVNADLRMKLEHYTKAELMEVYAGLPQTPYKQTADLSTAKRLIRAIEICTWEQFHSRDENPASKKIAPLIFGLDPGREDRRRKIRERLIVRLQHGLIEEVEGLLQNGVPVEKLLAYGLEYAYVTRFLRKEIGRHEMEDRLTVAIQQFAKRQMTWFRKMEREGAKIHWIDASLPLEKQLGEVMKRLDA